MQLSVNVFLSLDGVMQGPGGAEEDRSGGFEAGGWMVSFVDQDMGAIVDGEWFAHAGAVLLGRNTFQSMREYWTTVTDDSIVNTVLNTYPKYLVTSTLRDPDWGDTTVIDGDIVGRIRELKEKPGKELQVHGSWQLAHTLHNAGLVDIYRLLIFPVAVGSGKRLFAEPSASSAFDVVSQRTTSVGAVSLVLRPKPLQTGTFAVEDGREVTR